MSESEIPAAIAEQEEHIRRVTSCGGVIGLAHSFDWFAARPDQRWRQCWRCGVTETREDYAMKMAGG